jgi:nitric oxide reductase NorQ protein
MPNAGTLSEQKKPLFLLFKTGPEKFHVFQIVGWKARIEHFVEGTAPSTPSCDCQLFRFESKCPHTEAIATEAEKWAYAFNDLRSAGKPIKWQEGDDKKFVVIAYQGKAGEPAVVHPEVGDLSLFNLVWLLTEGPTTSELKSPTGFLNPERIFEEAKKSFDLSATVTDTDVIAAGKAVKPLTAADVQFEADYDENLGAMIPGEKEPATPKKGRKKTKTEVAKPWETIKRPDPKSFYIPEKSWKQLLYGMAKGQNIMIMGPAGSGKSEIVYIGARAMSLDLAAFNCGAMSEPREALIGTTIYDPAKGTWHREARFVKAVRADRGVVLLDEMSRAVRDAFNIFLPLLDRQGYLAMDESEDGGIIKKGAGVSFVATANVGLEYTGTEALDKALKERFRIIRMGFPPREWETKILVNRCPGLKAGQASRLVGIAEKQRELATLENEFVEQISTRMLLAAGEQIGLGFTFDDAIEFNIANLFSDEGGDASEYTRIMQIVQKGGE